MSKYNILFILIIYSYRILDINLNPQNDLVITSSLDKTSRIWDTNKRTCIAIIQDSDFANFDPKGNFFVAVTRDKSNCFLNFYSIENYTKNNNYHSNYFNCDSHIVAYLDGPYKVLKIKDMNGIRQLKFSPDGLFLILKDLNNLTFIYDLFTWTLNSLDTSNSREEDFSEKKENFFGFDISLLNHSSSTSDDNYNCLYTHFIFNGCRDGYVQVWNYLKGNVVNLIEYHEKGENIKVKFNSKCGIMATACKDLILWK